MHATSVTTQDTAYPTFLYQVLEECWQQEQFRRPTSELLHTALVGLTGLSVRGGGGPTQTTHGLLLDSYMLHCSSRVSAIHSVMGGDGGICGSQFLACAALSSLDDNNCASIVALQLSQQNRMVECSMETKVGTFYIMSCASACVALCWWWPIQSVYYKRTGRLLLFNLCTCTHCVWLLQVSWQLHSPLVFTFVFVDILNVQLHLYVCVTKKKQCSWVSHQDIFLSVTDTYVCTSDNRSFIESFTSQHNVLYMYVHVR